MFSIGENSGVLAASSRIFTSLYYYTILSISRDLCEGRLSSRNTNFLWGYLILILFTKSEKYSMKYGSTVPPPLKKCKYSVPNGDIVAVQVRLAASVCGNI